MIQYNNQNSFKEIHYNGHDIQKVYCDTGDLVWQKQSPTPPTFDGKFKLILDDESVISAECDATSAITENEVSSQYSGSVVSAEIGDCVTSIGDSAFTYCTGLTSVTIPDSVTSIGGDAFRYCSGLTSIDIPDSVTSIGGTAFQRCMSLTSVTIPASVTYLNAGVFSYCKSLISITIEAVTPYQNDGQRPFTSTNNCPIYVPAQSVDAYKSVWDLYADRIQAIPNS